jgi:proline dehydrogenase
MSASPAAFGSDHAEDHQHQHQHESLLARAPLSSVDFSDSASAHGSKTSVELLRAIAVFNACRFPLLVKHAEGLIDFSATVLGTSITNVLVKHSFFKHFCAGEDSADMTPVIDMLKQNNIGPILDYAAESEGNLDDNASGGVEDIFTQPPFNQPARVYDYKSEAQCDRHVEVFKNCIRSAHDVSPTHGFAALKVTALGNPELLERMSTMIVEVHNLFSKFDEKGTGLISQEEFVRCYEHYFHADDGKLSEIIELLECHSSGMIDYISFSQMFTPYTLPAFTLKCKKVGPLALATPSEDEIVLMKKMSERLHTLAQEAARSGTKLLIDAEHQKYQPAIDNLVIELQQKYNAKDQTERPVIFNTYQCYLKDTPERIMTDLRRAKRFSFHFAAKLVRGAYMVHERKRAKEMNNPSPIHDTAANTHRCYNESIELLLRHRSQHGPGLEIMVATHNQDSIEKAVALMRELDLGPKDESVHFAQLFGMSDNLTFTLGNHGYNAFKYLPYGEVQEVVPYLLRRAQENGDVLGNTGTELALLQEELKKRFLSS